MVLESKNKIIPLKLQNVGLHDNIRIYFSS